MVTFLLDGMQASVHTHTHTLSLLPSPPHHGNQLLTHTGGTPEALQIFPFNLAYLLLSLPPTTHTHKEPSVTSQIPTQSYNLASKYFGTEESFLNRPRDSAAFYRAILSNDMISNFKNINYELFKPFIIYDINTLVTSNTFHHTQSNGVPLPPPTVTLNTTSCGERFLKLNTSEVRQSKNTMNSEYRTQGQTCPRESGHAIGMS